nr:S26 family signal peptidase [Candidatus Sigynarchaeota archaeon]
MLWVVIIVASATPFYAYFTIAYNPTVIMSESMMPVLHVGDVVLIDSHPDFTRIEAGAHGDIIVIKNYSVFLQNSVPSYLYEDVDATTSIIHRVIEKKVDDGMLYFVTKG